MTNCADCASPVEDWLAGSFCVACTRRHRALHFALRAYQLVVEFDEIAATLAAGLVTRLERPAP